MDLKKDIISWREIEMLIFDIGSNNFKFSLECKKQYPDCKIIAVDAIHEYKLLYESDEKYRNNNIIFLNKIISDIHGQNKTINVNISEPGMSTVSEEFLHNSRFSAGNEQILQNYFNASEVRDSTGARINLSFERWRDYIATHCGSIRNFLKQVHIYEKREVETTTLDKLIKNYGEPELIKIDVEGYENIVLKGLTKKVKKICFEWNEECPESLYDSLENLDKLGYEKFSISGYLEEGDVYDFLSYDEGGDTYLKEPVEYYSLDNIKSDLKDAIQKNRRSSWGMAWAKR